MASLIESNASSVAEFKATLDSADRLTSLLYGGYGDDEVAANPQQSSLITLDEDLWRELYLLPTPPLSPEGLENAATVHSSTSPTQTTHSVGNEIAPGNTDLFVDMLGYDQMMDVLEEAERVLTDSQQAHQQDLLLQDCMWSGGGNSEGLLLGSINTANPGLSTAPSATTDSNSIMNSDSTLQCADSTGPDTQSIPMDDTQCSNDSEAEPDCVEPSAVFPVLRSSETTHKIASKSTRMPSCSLRSNSSSSSSESEEEIDVVTVERSSHDHLPSGKSSILSSSHGSSSAGGHHQRYSGSSKKQLSSSSRHTSSISGSIRKKRHTKKISRRSSEDGAESDEEARRASHNVLERKRRNDLKNSFDILRGCIPELEENLRAPKVVILRKSVEYISSLQSTEQRTKVEYNKEQARYKKLAERLSLLRNGVVTC